MSVRSFAALALLLLLGIQGPAAQVSLSSSTPTVNVVRLPNVSGNTWSGDFNGDGKVDVVSLTTSPSTQTIVRVLLGNGFGGFFTAVDTPIVTQASEPVRWTLFGAADLNADGRLDLVALADDEDPAIVVFPGNDDGTFAPFRFLSFVSTSGISFIELSDFDGDGKRDVAAGDFEGVVRIYPGNGDVTFGAEIDLRTGLWLNGGTVADFNSDGRLDVAAASVDSNEVTIFLNQGAFIFSATDIHLDRSATDVEAVDVNGDGALDLLVTTAAMTFESPFGRRYHDGYVYVMTGRADGTFSAPITYQVATGANRIALGDFTRDGILDIVTGNSSAILLQDCGASVFKTWTSASILPGNGDGTFAAASTFSLGTQENTDDLRYRFSVASLTAINLNNDGAMDILASDGVFFLSQLADPNWPPTVDLGPDQTITTTSTTISARARDDDQDMLSYRWMSSDGTTLPPIPVQCLSGLANGAHTYTVTVDDGHGHQTSDSITVNVNIGGTGGTGAGTTIAITSPTEGATLTSGVASTLKIHIEDAAQAVYEWTIYYSLDNGATWDWIPGCHLTGLSSSPDVPTSRDEQCTWDNPGPASTQALLIAQAQDDADASVAGSGPVHITIAPPPGNLAYPWQQLDIGAVATAGSVSYANGAFNVTGSGADIWGAADEFHYVYQDSPVGGTFMEMITRVDAVQNIHAWTKAGLMFRRTLAADAEHVSIFLTPGKGVAFQRRTSAGGTSVNTSGPLLTAPVWLRLVWRSSVADGFKMSNVVAGYYRKNDTDAWMKLGEVALSPSVVGIRYAGLAVSSHADGSPATAAFSNVTIDPWPTWSVSSSGQNAGSGSYDGTSATLTSVGSDIWGTADGLTFLNTTWDGDGTISARVQSVDNTNAWAKAGVMFRNSRFANSAHVDLVVTPGKGIAMQYRATTGGTSAQVAVVPGAAPVWLRLTRTGNTFTGAWSSDKSTWHTVGAVSLALNPEVFAALPLTSHNTAATATAVFWDLSLGR